MCRHRRRRSPRRHRPLAPTPTPVPTPVPKEKLVLRGVHFDFDRSDIRPEDEPVLDEAVTVLKSEPQVRLYVDGYCDAIGSDDYNLELSAERAASVVTYFENAGISRAAWYREALVRRTSLQPTIPMRDARKTGASSWFRSRSNFPGAGAEAGLGARRSHDADRRCRREPARIREPRDRRTGAPDPRERGCRFVCSDPRRTVAVAISIGALSAPRLRRQHAFRCAGEYRGSGRRLRGPDAPSGYRARAPRRAFVRRRDRDAARARLPRRGAFALAAGAGAGLQSCRHRQVVRAAVPDEGEVPERRQGRSDRALHGTRSKVRPGATPSTRFPEPGRWRSRTRTIFSR